MCVVGLWGSHLTCLGSKLFNDNAFLSEHREQQREEHETCANLKSSPTGGA